MLTSVILKLLMTVFVKRYILHYIEIVLYRVEENYTSGFKIKILPSNRV